jgi:REP element-mobilizing transposase RayT
MPQSHARVALHLTFSTKNRHPWLKDRKVCKDLYAYMATILQDLESPAVLINGVADHVHILFYLSRNYAIKKIVEEVKKEPSKWMKQQGQAYKDFYWQAGYGIFSVSQRNIEAVRRYIENQDEHHRRRTFQEEFRIMCAKHGIEIDERYVWD